MSSLIRFHYDPFFGLDSLFDDGLSARSCPSAEACQCPRTQPLDTIRPRLDLHESKDSNVVTATLELPGLKSEDVCIDVRRNRLTVSGESTGESTREEGGHAIRERHYGKFSRTLRLPFGTKAEDIKAKMEDGLLTLTFPRTTPEEQPQRVAIQ